MKDKEIKLMAFELIHKKAKDIEFTIICHNCKGLLIAVIPSQDGIIFKCVKCGNTSVLMRERRISS